jgi:hypothetical protein
VVSAEEATPSALRLFLRDEELPVHSAAVRPKPEAARSDGGQEYEGEFFCPPGTASRLSLGLFLWAVGPVEGSSARLFRVILTGVFLASEGGAVRCQFVAVGALRVLPPDLPVSELVAMEEAVRASRNSPEAVETYREWCLTHGWEQRVAELPPTRNTHPEPPCSRS